MFRFAVRVERAWSALPAAARLTVVAMLVAALFAMSVVPALAAAADPNPFRWK